MTPLYVKDLSKLTGVSIQTLHHYDRIHLLKASYRHGNGYRLYSEKDLLKLQQILALKFFGFKLSQIKTLLTENVDMFHHFSLQAQALEKKAKMFLEASQTLKSIISEYQQSKSVPWKTILTLIEVYRMAQDLEHTWAGKVFTTEELKQYANFETDLKTRFTEEEKEAFEATWKNLIHTITSNFDKDPTSDFGRALGHQIMDLINGLYGKEHANLKHSIWENGFKKGQMEGEHFVAPEIIEWMDKAIDCYYRTRIYNLLKQAEPTNIPSHLSLEWKHLMDEMFGNSTPLKQGFLEEAMNDPLISQDAKKWLKILPLC